MVETLRLKLSNDPKTNRDAVMVAAAMIRRGDIVAFPTETVYGLGADAFNSKAVGKIYKAKNRPPSKALILHIASEDQLKEIVRELPPGFTKLAEKFWPGPLTFILPKTEKVPAIVTAGKDNVAVRMPDHPVARDLIEFSRTVIAAPSANTSHKPAPTSAQEVLDDLGGKIDAILDGGPTTVGIPSTIIDLFANPPVIHRLGAISLEMIEEVLGHKVNLAKN